MKSLKNSNGMTLVTVMSIIVIFSIVGLTLMNLTVTNAKQIQKVEQDMQSVDVAEMGVVKYRNELIIEIDKNLRVIILDAIHSLETYNKANPKNQIIIDSNSIINEMSNLGHFSNLNSLFQLGIDPAKEFQIAEDIYYTIKEKPPTPISFKEIELNYLSTGYTVGKSSTIEGSLTIDLESLIKENFKGGQVNNDGSLIDDPYQKYSNDVSNKCTNTTPIVDKCRHINGVSVRSDIINTTAIIDKEFSYTGNNTSMKNSHLLVNTNINISKINLYNSTLYSNGAAKFGQMSSSNLKDSTIYAAGSLDMGNFNSGKINNTKLFSGGAMFFKNANFDLTNSIIHAKGHLALDSFNGTINNSVIYVEYDFTNYKQANFKINNSLICVGQKIIGDLANREDGIKIISKAKSPVAYAKSCPPNVANNSPSSLDDLIPDIANIVNDADYIYQ